MKNLESNPKEKSQPQGIKSLIKSYDVVGDIAIIQVRKHLGSEDKIVAQGIMQTHKHVKTVLRQVGAVSGTFRLRQLKWVAGEKKTETLYKESGCIFRADLEQCYFSPRLSFERRRIANMVKPKEIIVNMFAGVGSFSVLMAKYGKAETVYSIDLNPSAFKYMTENIRLNRVERQVLPILGDAQKVIVEQLQNAADRVVMPLPEKAYEHLDSAILALKPAGSWIHYYDFEHAAKNENPIEKVKAKVFKKLQKLGHEFALPFGRVVRHTGPNWYQIVLDIEIRGKRHKPERAARR